MVCTGVTFLSSTLGRGYNSHQKEKPLTWVGINQLTTSTFVIISDLISPLPGISSPSLHLSFGAHLVRLAHCCGPLKNLSHQVCHLQPSCASPSNVIELLLVSLPPSSLIRGPGERGQGQWTLFQCMLKKASDLWVQLSPIVLRLVPSLPRVGRLERVMWAGS